MDVGGWLRGLGLGQYEEQFRDNKIDADLLPRLTVDDLKDIGVSVVGDRRRLLDAIAVLAAAGPASPTTSAPSKGHQASAERRPITVMFCDLVGSTSLAAKLDAEDWRNLVNAYLDEASAAVTGLGGHVLKKLGDGLMALFGYPHAQENDAERAVRSALAIQRALSDLNTRNVANGAPELSVRIGLESGQVVVDATGEVFGDAPNVAARVQAAAEPGSVLITGNVQRQVAGLFVVEEKGAHEFKGVTQPLSLYRVVRASGGGRRGGVRALTSFVGREEDIGTLLRRWDRVRAGEGQFVQIVGEPGLGKSRLVEEFHSTLGETPHTWVEWNSSQLLQNTPLHPVAEWGRARFGGQDVAAERRLADLETTLAQVKLDVQEAATLLAPLLDIPLPAERAPKFGPEELRRRQLAAMVALLLAGARTQPVVLAFEDLHWADPTSLDLIQALAERGAQAPLLVVATTRPEFRAPWGMRSHHAVIALAPLDRVEVRRMVGEIAAQHALSEEVVERVSERTGGVPLFVEEVTRLLLERGDTGSQAVPPTLQQSLAARLDRLGAARDVAQIGAVLGCDFAYTLLRDVAEADETALQASLDRLADADLLFVKGAPPEADYRFKHALIQDAAYDSLLKSRRQALHRRAAELLRDNPERAVAEPEVIAHHFTQAGLDDLAIEWWGKAGDQALRRSAFQEKIAHLGRAIEMADKAAAASLPLEPTKTAVTSHRMKLQSDYGQAVRWAKGFSAAETKAAFDRAAEMAATIEDFSERFAALNGQWSLAQLRGELRKARELASDFLREAESAGRLMEAGVAHRGLAFMSYFTGDFLGARFHCEQALAMCSPERDQEARKRSGEDTRAVAMAMLALASWQLGEIDRARELIEAANRRAAEIGHVPSMAVPLQLKSVLEIVRGDASAALTASEALGALSREHGMALQQIWAELESSWAHGRLDDPKGGAFRFQQALAALGESGHTVDTAFFLGLLAQLDAEAFGVETALSRVDEALALSNQVESRYYVAFLHRLRGDLLLKLDPGASSLAEDAFLAAIAVAKEQSARSYQLQAALPLAKLYRSTNRPAEAHAVLVRALEGFSPTPEMPEIAEAKALLEALAEMEEVKVAASHKQRQAQLQVAYGNALIAARGPGSPETTDAFAKARGSTFGAIDAPERLAADYGLWASSFTRGESPLMRAYAAAFFSDVEPRPDSPEAGVAHRAHGVTLHFAGDYLEAREHLERALALFRPCRDDDLAFRFGPDPGVAAMAYLAIVSWPLGEVDHAISHIDRMQTRMAGVSHIGTLAMGRMHAAMFELMRADHARATENAVELTRLAREHELPMYGAFGAFLEGWAAAQGGAPGRGVEDMRRGVENLRAQNVLVFDGLLKVALAEAETRAGDPGRAIAVLDEALATVERTGYRAFEAELNRAHGEILLKRDPTEPAPAEEAFLTAIAVARQQRTRSFELRAALSLAKLYQSTSRPLDAHVVLAPALEGFTPTPEMPEITEAQALLAALAESDAVKAEAAQRQRLTQLHVAYGNALFGARGYGAQETTEAFARARESASGDMDAPGRLAADYGMWVGSYVRGELPSMRAHAAAFLSDVEPRPDSPEAGVAHRAAGITCWFAGEYREAREHFERALALFQPGRDDDLAFRFGHDAGVGALCWLAIASWPLGEVDRAISVIDRLQTRIANLTHIGTLAFGKMHAAMFELMRGDPPRAAQNAFELACLLREHEGTLFRPQGMFLEGWATAASGAIDGGLEDMRRGEEIRRGQNTVIFDGLLKITLAEAEARAGDPDRAITILDEALATVDRTGFRAFEAELHRARGENLLKCDPANSTPAEDAFLTAIAVAKRQGTRSFELRAALALAKLYQSTGRPVEAHTVLAPAPEAFSPTPELPEIAEAEALLTALKETDEVKAEAARRQRRQRLQVTYGNALIAARGFGAPETTEAFAIARESAHGDNAAPERLAADYGLWASSYVRGELASMRTHAAAFLAGVSARPNSAEAGVAHRVQGITHYFAGEYVEALRELERALALFQPGRDDDLAFRFSPDSGVAAMIYLALVSWPLGEVGRAVSLVDRMKTRIAGLSHATTLAHGALLAAFFALMRGDRPGARTSTHELARVVREHDLALFRAGGEFLIGWATADGGAPGEGLAAMRRGAESLSQQNALVFDGIIKIALAEGEAGAGDPDRAIAILDEALATVDRIGYRAFEAELSRTRGETLLKRDAANADPAEEAFRTALSVAREQGARSFGLRAALSLAKLYQSTGRPAEAHAVLEPALQGFSSTPEMPEIAQAQTLLAAIEASAHVRHE